MAAMLLTLAACGEPVVPPITVGMNPWVGYDPLVLARDRGLADAKQLRVVELASASETLRHLRNGLLDAATLTLDETLRTRITVMYRKPSKSALQPLVEGGRARANLLLAPASLAGGRILARELKKVFAVGILPDQTPHQGEGIWVDYFGTPAYTMTLAARLTESGAAVIVVWAERLPAGAGYHFHLQAPTEPLHGSTEQRAQQINRELELLIRQCPQQYLWAYNRYKRPRGVEAPQEGH